jgi:hypothetical protein
MIDAGRTNRPGGMVPTPPPPRYEPNHGRQQSINHQPDDSLLVPSTEFEDIQNGDDEGNNFVSGGKTFVTDTADTTIVQLLTPTYDPKQSTSNSNLYPIIESTMEGVDSIHQNASRKMESNVTSPTGIKSHQRLTSRICAIVSESNKESSSSQQKVCPRRISVANQKLPKSGPLSPGKCGRDNSVTSNSSRPMSSSIHKSLKVVIDELNKLKQSREDHVKFNPRTIGVAQQAFWFLMAFMLAHVWSTANRIYQALHRGRALFPLTVFHSFFDPFQGALNFLLYQRPRYMIVRKKHPNIGRLGAIWSVLRWSRFHSTLQHCGNEEYQDRKSKLLINNSAIRNNVGKAALETSDTIKSTGTALRASSITPSTEDVNSESIAFQTNCPAKVVVSDSIKEIDNDNTTTILNMSGGCKGDECNEPARKSKPYCAVQR